MADRASAPSAQPQPQVMADGAAAISTPLAQPPLTGMRRFDPHGSLSQHHGDMVPLAAVVRRVTHHAMASLRTTLSWKGLSPVQSDERKRALLEHVRQTRLLLTKLALITQWAHHSSAFVCAQSIVALLQADDAAFDATVFMLHAHADALNRARARNFDVATAIDVLSSGQYRALPKIMKTSFIPEPLRDDEVAQTMAALNDMIRMRLVSMECGVPAELLRDCRIDMGRVIFTVAHEFELTLTLPGGPDPNGPWHILDFRILDPNLALHEYQRQNLVHIGNSKLLAASGAGAAQVPPQPPPVPAAGSTAVVPAPGPTVHFPLLEVYHFFHHFILTLRLEKLVVESYTLLNSPNAPGLDTISVKDDGRTLELAYWSNSRNGATVRVALRETERRDVINISAHPVVQCPPEPTATPALVALPAKPTTASFTYSATSLVVQHLGRETPIVESTTLTALLAQCLDTHTARILAELATLVERGAVNDGMPGPPPPPAVPEAALVGGSGAAPPQVKDGALHLPAYAVSIAVHRQSGKFHVAPLDRYNEKLQHLEAMLNEDPLFLPHTLANYATARLMDRIVTSVTFLGLVPSPRPPNALTVASSGQAANLGPRVFLRVVHKPAVPEYHLAVNVVQGVVTCWVLHWPSMTVVKEYHPSLHDLVETFDQYTSLHQIQAALAAKGVHLAWHGAGLGIDPLSFPPGAGLLLAVETLTVVPLETPPQVHVQCRLKYAPPGLGAITVLAFKAKSVRTALRRCVVALGIVHLLVQSDPRDVVDVDLDAGSVRYRIGAAREMLVQVQMAAASALSAATAASAGETAGRALVKASTSQSTRSDPSSSAPPAVAKVVGWTDAPYSFRVTMGTDMIFDPIARAAQAYLNQRGHVDLCLPSLCLAVHVWTVVASRLNAHRTQISRAYPRLVVKSAEFATVYLTRTAALHLRYLLDETRRCLIVSARHFPLFASLSRAVTARVTSHAGLHAVALPNAIILPASDARASAVDAMLDALLDQYTRTRVLLDAHAALVARFPPGRPTSASAAAAAAAAEANQPRVMQYAPPAPPRDVSVDDDAVRFVWCDVAVRVTATAVHADADAVPAAAAAAAAGAGNGAAPPPLSVDTTRQLGVHERRALARLLQFDFAHGLAAAGVPPPSQAPAASDPGALMANVVDALMTLMALPVPVIRAIAQCSALVADTAPPRHVALLFLAPPKGAVPHDVQRCLPPPTRPCLLVSRAAPARVEPVDGASSGAPGAPGTPSSTPASGGGGNDEDSVSLVFVLTCPPVPVGAPPPPPPIYVPVTYAWSSNVVSPWEGLPVSAAARGGAMNPTELLAFLNAKGGMAAAVTRRRNVADVVNDLKREGFAVAQQENLLVWTMRRVVARHVGELA
ncbi:mediator complex subunit [Allomyces javanicus]|nr:mediator complex subunit [Allomyces javanicus]